MKRKDVEKHLYTHGCFLLREGNKHSIYHNPVNGRTSAIPRHTEIFAPLPKKICKDLGIPPIQSK